MPRHSLSASAPSLIVLALALVAAQQVRAEGYRCVGANGAVTLSDHACAAGDVRQQPLGLSDPSTRAPVSENDPYSLMNQMRELDARKAQVQAQRNTAAGAAKRPAVVTETPPVSAAEAAMTYGNPWWSARRDPGHHPGSTHARGKSDRVDADIAKYRRTPIVPTPPDTNAAVLPRNRTDNRVHAGPAGGISRLGNTTGGSPQRAAGGVIDTHHGKFMPTH